MFLQTFLRVEGCFRHEYSTKYQSTILNDIPDSMANNVPDIFFIYKAILRKYFMCISYEYYKTKDISFGPYSLYFPILPNFDY